MPLRLIAWGDPVALSVVDKEPVRDPACVGMKLTLSVQFAPGAREPGLDASSRQDELATRLKLVEALGRTVKLRFALPIFAMVTLLGLSELVRPTAVEAKARVGGIWSFISFAALLPLSAT